ncbi:MAG: hypothetical protein KDC05_09305 [Bacteroidales bacterium]|nr:hypothetical protein [Bacteroidales bacterium]
MKTLCVNIGSGLLITCILTLLIFAVNLGEVRYLEEKILNEYIPSLTHKTLHIIFGVQDETTNKSIKDQQTNATKNKQGNLLTKATVTDAPAMESVIRGFRNFFITFPLLLFMIIFIFGYVDVRKIANRPLL